MANAGPHGFTEVLYAYTCTTPKTRENEIQITFGLAISLTRTPATLSLNHSRPAYAGRSCRSAAFCSQVSKDGVRKASLVFVARHTIWRNAMILKLTTNDKLSAPFNARKRARERIGYSKITSSMNISKKCSPSIVPTSACLIKAKNGPNASKPSYLAFVIVFPPELKVKPTYARRASRSLNRVEFDDVRGSAVAYESHGRRRSTAHHDDFLLRDGIFTEWHERQCGHSIDGLGWGRASLAACECALEELDRCGIALHWDKGDHAYFLDRCLLCHLNKPLFEVLPSVGDGKAIIALIYIETLFSHPFGTADELKFQRNFEGPLNAGPPSASCWLKPCAVVSALIRT